jgi:integrase
VARRGHGEGTISKKPNGKYLAQVSIGTERFTKTLETRKDAIDWIRAKSDLVKNGGTSEGTKKSIEEFIDSWLNIKATKSRPATIEQYDRIRRLYINPHLGKIQLRELTAARIQSFYTILQSKGTGLRTIELCHIVLHGLLSHALRLGLIHRNWTEAVECPRPEKSEMQIWNESQVNQFLAATGNDIFYRFAFFTGMRRGELIGLQWKDVDWKNSMIKVERQVYKPMKGSFIIQPPKTERGRRAIRLGPGLMGALRDHYKYTIPRMIAIAGPDDWKDHDLIFPSTVGTPKNV